jgi:SAM-dependent methyltransferase
MLTERLHRLFYSDPKYDGTQRFYGWVRQYATRETRLLNIGAGPATNSKVRSLKGEVAWVAGADIDPKVLENAELDEAKLIGNGDLPFPDASFGLAVSDYVLEHVEMPRKFLSEVHRVLKPGASFFFRTPNLWHYVALASAMTPQRFHEAVANRMRRLPSDHHPPYPTYYRMNRRSALLRLANQVGFRRIELNMVETEPSYLAFNPIVFLGGTGYERTVNCSRIFSGFRANIFGRLEK